MLLLHSTYSLLNSLNSRRCLDNLQQLACTAQFWFVNNSNQPYMHTDFCLSLSETAQHATYLRLKSVWLTSWGSEMRGSVHSPLCWYHTHAGISEDLSDGHCDKNLIKTTLMQNRWVIPYKTCLPLICVYESKTYPLSSQIFHTNHISQLYQLCYWFSTGIEFNDIPLCFPSRTKV